MFCMLLLVAGNETTTNLVSNAALALFARPAAEQRLRDDPSLIPAAMEEALRYDAPVQGLMRRVTEDVELGDGTKVPAGDTVTISYGSANRDERKYGDDAGEFVVDRYEGRKGVADHVGFGGGIHYCLGAPLARLEAKVVFDEVLQRTAGMHQTGEGKRTSNLIVRGMKSLPVAFDPVG